MHADKFDDPKETGKFLEVCNLPRPNQEEMQTRAFCPAKAPRSKDSSVGPREAGVMGHLAPALRERSARGSCSGHHRPPCPRAEGSLLQPSAPVCTSSPVPQESNSCRPCLSLTPSLPPKKKHARMDQASSTAALTLLAVSATQVAMPRLLQVAPREQVQEDESQRGRSAVTHLVVRKSLLRVCAGLEAGRNLACRSGRAARGCQGPRGLRWSLLV